MPNTRTIVTRLPGTFGSAYEPIGSTVSSAEPAGSLTAQSGSATLESVSITTGSAFPIRNAQASPAKTAM